MKRLRREETGSSGAFERYVLPELDVLFGVAMTMTRNHADAEDLVQETLLRAYRAIDRFDGRYPRAWLLTILRNEQYTRSRRRGPELLAHPDAGLHVLEQQDPHESAEQQAIERTFDYAVERAFNRLSPKFREVVELVDLSGLTYREAAHVLDVPEGTVMSRLHRARRRMRRWVKDVDVIPRSDR